MNGLMVSMGIGYVIRNYIPEMRIETLHIWLLFAGYFHTTFGQRAGSVEAQAEQSQVITLEWDWGFRDTLALANVLQLGATFAAASQCGNEPGFVTTFAAGVSPMNVMLRVDARGGEPCPFRGGCSTAVR